MATQNRTEGERIANLEGQIAHLATKADIGVLGYKIEYFRAEMNTIKWIISIAIPAAIAITGIVVGIVAQMFNELPTPHFRVNAKHAHSLAGTKCGISHIPPQEH